MTIPQKIDPSRIRSFIRRQGRATAGQKLALESYWDKYCLSPQPELDLTLAFGRSAPLIVEIGFGNGNCLAEMAAANPDLNYLGIEVHRPGVGHLLLLLEERGINNVRVFHHDAIEILEQKISDHSISGVHLFFPDPWQKRRHHKRRIVRSSFIDLLNKKLVPGGYFHAATDWEHYAKDMLKILSAGQNLQNTSPDKSFCPRPDYRPLTKFENRGLGLGHGVWDLIFRKQ
jgi:tRNA (guanine-N7-)-methyltransferase